MCRQIPAKSCKIRIPRATKNSQFLQQDRLKIERATVANPTGVPPLSLEVRYIMSEKPTRTVAEMWPAGEVAEGVSP